MFKKTIYLVIVAILLPAFSSALAKAKRPRIERPDLKEKTKREFFLRATPGKSTTEFKSFLRTKMMPEFSKIEPLLGETRIKKVYEEIAKSSESNRGFLENLFKHYNYKSLTTYKEIFTYWTILKADGFEMVSADQMGKWYRAQDPKLNQTLLDVMQGTYFRTKRGNISANEAFIQEMKDRGIDEKKLRECRS